MILKIIRNVNPVYIYYKRYNLHAVQVFSLVCARSWFIRLIIIFIINCAPSERLNISQSTVHPWYWAHGNRTVLLLGASDDDNLFQWSEDDLNNQLDRLVRVGGNFIRNTMSDRKEDGFEVYPFQEIRDGIYDLNEWNEDYWIRFERLLVETEKRDIVVQIDIWDHYDFTGSNNFSEEGHWQAHPYNPKNNINYDLDESSFVVSYPVGQSTNNHSFFLTTPDQNNNVLVLKYQERFVHKILDYTLDYNHVLYCINSETNGGLKWYTHWARFIREKASLKNKRVYIGKTSDNLVKEGKERIETSDPASMTDFFDIPEISYDRDQTIWNKFVSVRNHFKNYPHPINTTGTSAAAGYNFVDNDQDGIGRFWRNLIGGSAAIRFQSPDSRLDLNDKAISCIKTARKIETMVQFWSMQPYNNLLSELTENTSYVLADIGRSYIVYIPSGGEATLDVSDAENSLELFWFEIDPAVMGKRNAQFPEFVSRQSQLRLKPPGQGNWVAVLLQKNRAD